MAPPKSTTTAAILKLLICVAGIYSAYITQGVFQEKLATETFGPNGARFPALSTLNGFQSLACFMWAFLLLQLQAVLFGEKKAKDSPDHHPPWYAYWRAGATNFIGPACGFQALYYISYPAQVLAKSSKMIPVMVLGTVLHNKRYSPVEYVCCFLVTAGVGLFAIKSSGHSKGRLAAPNAPLGYALCMANLMLDGYTNVSQDEINRRYNKGGSAMQMMCWMNFWTAVFYLPAMFALSSTGLEVASFCVAHPDAGLQVVLFCVCGAVGQLFIFYTIRSFGSLVNTLITTTRKFFSILASVVWAGNALLPQQWLAVFLVFGGLIMSSVTKHQKHARLKNVKSA